MVIFAKVAAVVVVEKDREGNPESKRGSGTMMTVGMNMTRMASMAVMGMNDQGTTSITMMSMIPTPP